MDEIKRLYNQQVALAQFGTEALYAMDLDELLASAVDKICEGLNVSHSKVLQPFGDGTNGPRRFLVRVAKGWTPDIIGNVVFEAEPSQSPAGLALTTRMPVITTDVAHERRFAIPRVLTEHGIQSCVNVVIQGKNGPFGVLEADAQRLNAFRDADTVFIQGFTNLLAAAIDRIDRTAQLHEANKAKDVLMLELQHRVKNNLQVIISLINQQRRTMTADMDVITSRIEALRIIYDRLYLINHHQEVNYYDYLHDLCANLLAFQSAKHKAVALDLHVDKDIRVHIDKAVPVGLIVTEFIINSFKHAFPDDKGTIGVDLHRLNGDVRLTLRDDGIGIKGTVDGRGTGLKLIAALASQAEATFTVQTPTKGTAIELVFAPDVA